MLAILIAQKLQILILKPLLDVANQSYACNGK